MLTGLPENTADLSPRTYDMQARISRIVRATSLTGSSFPYWFLASTRSWWTPYQRPVRGDPLWAVAVPDHDAEVDTAGHGAWAELVFAGAGRFQLELRSRVHGGVAAHPRSLQDYPPRQGVGSSTIPSEPGS